MPVAIQQSPEKCCTNLVHYSFLHQKRAKKQVVSGEKSPSGDGLQMTGKHRCRMAALPYPAYKVMLPSRPDKFAPSGVLSFTIDLKPA
ncbi:hypothetical protein D3H66_05445 [Citrobacter portucalensis]|uniref:Uncharacterized protein n=1 Tax=Citrobacter portucalensis TaxID=1639133 RepID=A0A5B0T5X6_9ENTR|nr:hypothetical protein D3H66_05445 [Citrobacter portucalensis]